MDLLNKGLQTLLLLLLCAGSYAQVTISGTVTHDDPQSTGSGAIDITPAGGTSPYTFLWDDAGSSTSEDLSSLGVGTYSVTVTDDNSATATASFEVKYDVVWEKLVGTSVSSLTLSKTAANGWENGGAASVNILRAGDDGYVEFEYDNLSSSHNMLIGLSMIDLGASSSTIRHGIQVDGTTVRVYEGVTNKYTLGSSASSGDVFRIERVGTTLNYKQNSTVLYTTTVDDDLDLIVDASIYGINHTVSDVHVDFGTPLRIDYTVEGETEAGDDGTITLDVKGGTPTYSYTWSDGPSTASSRTGLAAGSYTVSVVHNTNVTVTETIEVGYAIDWDDEEFISSSTGSSITTSAAEGYAVSRNYLPAGEDGYMEYTITEKLASYGLALSRFNLTHDINDMEYHSYKLTTAYRIYESGTWLSTITAGLEIGDVMRVERINDVIYYKINGVTKRSIATGYDEDMIIQFKGKSSSVKVENIKTNFGFEYAVKAAITDDDPETASDGAITLDVYGGESPYTYDWADVSGTSNSKDRASLAAGTYTVTVTDNNSATTTASFVVGYQVIWQNKVNVTTTANSITNTSTTGGYIAGASSVNYIDKGLDGYVEYRVDNTVSAYHTIGLSRYDFNENYQSIEYGLLKFADKLWYYENGLKTGAYSGDLAVGDLVRVERVSGEIKYSLNGTVLKTITEHTSAKLYIDINLGNGSPAANISVIKTNIGIPFGLTGEKSGQIPEQANTGSIDIDVLGGDAPYTYLWSNSATTQDITGLNTGTYTVTVTDNSSSTLTATFEVNYQTLWDNAQDVTTTAHSIIKNTTSTAFDAGASSQNYLLPSTDGFFEFTLAEAWLGRYYVGFSEEDLTYTNTDFEYYVYVNGSNLYFYYPGSSYTYGKINVSDIVKLSREGTDMKLYVNGVLKKTVSSIDDTKGYFVDIAMGQKNPDIRDLNIEFGTLIDYTTLYWTGAVNNDWSNTGNWSHFSNGASAGIAPDNTKNVIFDGGATAACNLSVNSFCKTFTISSGYTGTVNLSGYELDVAEDLNQADGTVTGSTAAIDVDGDFILTGGTFTNTTDVLSVGGDFTDGTGVFDYVTGTVSLSGTAATLTSSTNYLDVFKNLTIETGAKVTLANNVFVGEDLDIDGAVYGPGFTLFAADDATTSITGSGGFVNQFNMTGDVGMLAWQTGTATGTYTYPMLPRDDGVQSDFVADITTAGGQTSGHLMVATIGQTSSKVPDLASGVGFTYTNINGNDNKEYNANRVSFTWLFNYTQHPSGTYELHYNSDDLAGTSITEANLKAQYYDPITGVWSAATGTVDAVNDKVTVSIVASSTYGFWVLVDGTSPNYSNTGDHLYWTGAVDNDWNTVGNWSLYKNGSSAGVIPSSSTGVIFEDEANVACNLSANAVCKDFEILSGYTATINLSGYELHAYGDLNQADGTVTGSTAAIDVDGDFTLTGGTFTNTTDVLTVGGDFTDNVDAFDYVNGTVSFTGTSTLTTYSYPFPSLTVETGAELTLANQIFSSGDVIIDGTIYSPGHTLFVNKDAPTTISGNGGFVPQFDANGNAGLLGWEMSLYTGIYSYPLIPRDGGGVVPFVANITKSGGQTDGQLFVTTIGQDASKVPDLTGLGFTYTDINGNDNEDYTVNRFWMISYAFYTDYPEATYEFYYNAADLSGTSITEANLKAQFYNTVSGEWEETVGTVDVTNDKVSVTVPYNADLGFWTLVDGTSPNYTADGKFYWTGATDNDWNTASNWSEFLCGSAASAIPDATSTVVFSGCADVQADLAQNTSVQGLIYQSGYTKTVNKGAYSLTVATDIVLDGAALTVNASTLDFDNPIEISSGSITLSSNGVLDVTGDITVNGGSLLGDGTVTATNLVLDDGDVTSTSDLTLDADVTINGGVADADGNDLTIDGITIINGGSILAGAGNIDLTKSLEINDGSVDAGSGTLDITQMLQIDGGMFIVGSATVTTTGSVTINNGDFNAGTGTVSFEDKFDQNDGTFDGGSATITIDGTTDLDGGLFTSTSGTLNLYNNFTETEPVFVHNDGTVKLFGADIDITTNDDPVLERIEDVGFYNLEIGDLTNKDIQSDIVVNNKLDLVDGKLTLNSNRLIINNSATTGIATTTGYIIAETTDGESLVQWNVAEASGLYTIPFKTASGSDLTAKIDVTTAGFELNPSVPPYLSLTTYPVSGTKTPYPGDVYHFYKSDGTENLSLIANRYWLIDGANFSVEPAIDVTVKYTAADLTGTSITESDLTPYQWDGGSYDPLTFTLSTVNKSLLLSGIRIRGPIVFADLLNILAKLANINYAQLSDKLDASYYETINGKMYVKYNERYLDRSLDYTIYDWKRNVMASAGTNDEVDFGPNWMAIDVSGISLTEGDYYVLEVETAKGEIQKLRFKYMGPDVRPVIGTIGGGAGSTDTGMNPVVPSP